MTYALALSALADPTRRAIFEDIAKDPASVTQLATRRPVSRPAVSQHLKTLQNAGLVTSTAKGTARIYHLNRAGLAPLRAYVEAFWDDVLGAFAEEVSNQMENEDVTTRNQNN